jgi:hypothetical protein
VTYPVLDILNHGPGSVTLDFLIFDNRPWYRRLNRRQSYKTLTYLKAPIGVKLVAGDSHREILSDQDFVLGELRTLVGVCDTLRVAHWAPRKQIRLVTKTLRSSPKWKGFLKK